MGVWGYPPNNNATQRLTAAREALDPVAILEKPGRSFGYDRTHIEHERQRAEIRDEYFLLPSSGYRFLQIFTVAIAQP
ncbi:MULTISPECIES: hypothetical protein [Nostocales]|uniref:Uncharacterized protein n=1 Tax=Tolypothrix bouteillei VB521301 TaxID=1479485 RepID=A0A0C1NIA6_9CYAN